MVRWDNRLDEKEIIDSQNIKAVSYLRSHFTIQKLRLRKAGNLSRVIQVTSGRVGPEPMFLSS